ncbi:MAG: lipopolysaccharide assembly protein LapB [Gammaproteobacteria bacterium]|nr:lipopolysaccharide assembly protein LapB [Gammaproteobacteria bacterium]
MSDLLWFLLPVAAYSGWWVAVRQQKSRRSVSALTEDYYKGINYLLNEQQDKAMDIFVRMMDVNTDTVELHLALGTIFRKRGEVDRAITLHQNLIARPNLLPQQKELALLELAQDFLASGLLDRAERLLLDLKLSHQHCEQALRHLVDVYQFEKDWEKAIVTAQQYERISGRKLSARISHFYCELAEAAIAKSDQANGKALLKKALAVDVYCARANILVGAMEMQNQNYHQAIVAFMEVLEQQPALIGEVLPSLIKCYEAQGWEKNISGVLDEIWSRYKPKRSALLMSRMFARFGTQHDAEQVLRRLMLEFPSVQTLASYVNSVDLKTNPQGVEYVKNALSQMLSEGASYRCDDCGFSGKELHWQCPSCKAWGTIKPL